MYDLYSSDKITTLEMLCKLFTQTLNIQENWQTPDESDQKSSLDLKQKILPVSSPNNNKCHSNNYSNCNYSHNNSNNYPDRKVFWNF